MSGAGSTCASPDALRSLADAVTTAPLEAEQLVHPQAEAPTAARVLVALLSQDTVGAFRSNLTGKVRLTIVTLGKRESGGTRPLDNQPI